MTTALIGKVGALHDKAHVAVVARAGLGGFVAGLVQAGHEVREVLDWKDLADAGLDLVFCDDEAAAEQPADFSVPVVLVSDRTLANGTAAGMPSHGQEAALAAVLQVACALRNALGRAQELDQVAAGIRTGSALAGRSALHRRLCGVVSRAADSDATVLVEGPSGSGKSLVARIVHCKSRRGVHPLVAIDCGGADADAVAKALEASRNTTLVFEDIDRLNPPAQSVLVKHLKERSQAQRSPQPRLVATTAAHLPELVARGAFREDLYYRLNAFPMVVPALRERPEDVLPIAEAVLAHGAAQSGRAAPVFTPAAAMLLESMPWPGNVAQLAAVVRRAQAQAAGAPIDRDHLVPPAVMPSGGANQPQAVPSGHSTGGEDGELTEDSIRPFEEEEQILLTRALRATKGNVRRAAQLLGIGRATLYRKIQQYRLRLH
jgi:DNA-binding NtrC family response regulator